MRVATAVQDPQAQNHPHRAPKMRRRYGLEVVKPITLPGIDAYAEAHTTPPPAYLAALAEETWSSFADAEMLVGTLEGRFLELLVYLSRARNVLELGTFTGYSALSMASALPPDGRIVTCELELAHAAVARRHFDASPFADRIELRVGPALETIRDLTGLYDLVFIDADKDQYVDYYEATLPLLSERGLIAVDNTLWSGAVLDDSERDRSLDSIRAFNEHVRRDERVVCVLLTIRDGVTLIRKA
jgi:caffeoyl-CoA O-methyltransferase